MLMELFYATCVIKMRRILPTFLILLGKEGSLPSLKSLFA